MWLTKLYREAHIGSEPIPEPHLWQVVPLLLEYPQTGQTQSLHHLLRAHSYPPSRLPCLTSHSAGGALGETDIGKSFVGLNRISTRSFASNTITFGMSEFESSSSRIVKPSLSSRPWSLMTRVQPSRKSCRRCIKSIISRFCRAASPSMHVNS